MSRVDAVRIAVEKAQAAQPELLAGAVARLGRVLPVRRRSRAGDRRGRHARSSSRAARCATRRSSPPPTPPASRWSPPTVATSATEPALGFATEPALGSAYVSKHPHPLQLRAAARPTRRSARPRCSTCVRSAASPSHRRPTLMRSSTLSMPSPRSLRNYSPNSSPTRRQKTARSRLPRPAPARPSASRPELSSAPLTFCVTGPPPPAAGPARSGTSSITRRNISAGKT